jgi:iron complex transport system permease protein
MVRKHPADDPAVGRNYTASLLIAAVLILLASFFLGRYPAPYVTALSDITGNEMARNIVMNIRLPRVITAFMLGVVLSASGMVFQMVFRTPLVDSGFLGVSGGAAFGASLAIVAWGGQVYTTQVSAAIFALLGLGASAFIAGRMQFGDWALRLVLSGIAVSALYASGTGIIKYLADPLRALPEITFWLLGGLWGITWPDAVHVLAISIPCLSVIYAMRWRLNLLSMQDETAFSLASSPGRERLVLLLAAVLATAVVVSKAGQIGWVGLIVPNIARRLVGADAQRALPFSLLMGGIFVLVCDNLSRTVLSGEIPLGILTALAGATIFIGLLVTSRIDFRK